MVLIYSPSIENVFQEASAVCEMFANGERLNPTSTLNGNPQAFRNQSIGSFYQILLIFSLTVVLRIALYTIALALMYIDEPKELVDKSKLATILSESSLYVDFCSNLFSITITFFMSLNRCLCFTSKNWNYIIFEKYTIFPSVAFSFFISILGAYCIIWTSQVARKYYSIFGFVDVGPVGAGFKVLLNVNYELLTLVYWESIKLELLLTCLEYLAITNYLPEMVLPISITIGSFNILEKLKNAVTPKINQAVSVQGVNTIS
ncbi:hypothetical protein CAEBREN_03085 [Caenorhabditis brenneri]|uniref:Uncharacterized protein n=1 Tax=Caenorhabditis brenneri TaxID=135651 RepID=G0MT74_CAEBE|nr:hypothetical protein CAEBREN_03085 [Caenorhabditis brenneri]